MSEQKSHEQIFVITAVKAWDQWLGRASKLFDSLSDEQMLQEIAPGKNRPVYLLGHLIAVNDAMIPQLRLGEANFPAYLDTFVTKADRTVAELPPISELRQNWKEVNAKIDAHFRELSPAQWLERHATVSDEDFVNQQHRNRLAILLSRTSHMSYHIGQLLLQPKEPAA
jgi:hypothetical protein